MINLHLGSSLQYLLLGVCGAEGVRYFLTSQGPKLMWEFRVRLRTAASGDSHAAQHDPRLPHTVSSHSGRHLGRAEPAQGPGGHSRNLPRSPTHPPPAPHHWLLHLRLLKAALVRGEGGSNSSYFQLCPGSQERNPVCKQRSRGPLGPKNHILIQPEPGGFHPPPWVQEARVSEGKFNLEFLVEFHCENEILSLSLK